MITKLPIELERIKINQLDISVRSYNALRSRKVSTLGELLRLSDRDLLEINALGRKSLEDIRGAVTKVLLANGISETPSKATKLRTSSAPNEWALAPDNKAISPGGWLVPQALDANLDVSIDLLDLSTRALNVLAKCNVSTVWELLNFPRKKLFATENFGRRTLAEIESKLLRFQSVSTATLQVGAQGCADSPSLDKSLTIKGFVEKILSVLPDRQKSVLADRYGLWDGIAETLQDIGDKFGLTRERIRQIEAKAIKRVNRLYGHGAVQEFLGEKVTPYLSSNEDGSCGVFSEEEVTEILAGQDSAEQAVLALGFLQDIGPSGQALLPRNFIEVEPGIYTLNDEASSKYREVLGWIEKSLDARAKPLTEDVLLEEVVKTASRDLTPRQMRIASRILSISPRVALLSNGMVTLSHWKESVPRTAEIAAEAILKLMGKPAHYREIMQKALYHFKGIKGITDRTIQFALQAKRDIFVWVKPGTYGLVAWGLTKPPYIKDKLSELLAETQYPLPYWHLEEKVLEVCNCKPASVRMTLELNPRLFKKFDGDQFGLARHFSQQAAH
jgi:hypothetical protein